MSKQTRRDIRVPPGLLCHQGNCWTVLPGHRGLRHDSRQLELACDLRCAEDCERWPNEACPECPCKQHPKAEAWVLDEAAATRLLAVLRGNANDRRM